MRLFLLAFSAWALAHPAAGAERVVAYEIVDAREIPVSLTGGPGDPETGRALYLDDKLARCAACHGVPGGLPAATGKLAEAPRLGDVGRRLRPGAIRLWLVAPEVIAPGTRMPSFYALGQRDDPADPRFGEPLLTAAEIEDLVAYLAGLRGGAQTGEAQAGEAQAGRP
jgi:L-cysteine S-thiosulfotransferase